MRKINISRRVLIADADFFGDRREDAAFRCRRRRSTCVDETNKSLSKKLTPTQPQVAASTKRTALDLFFISLCLVFPGELMNAFAYISTFYV